MGLATPGRTRIVCAVLALLMVALLVDGTAWWRAARVNARIEAGTVDPNEVEQIPELRFAQANLLAQAQGQGQGQGPMRSQAEVPEQSQSKSPPRASSAPAPASIPAPALPASGASDAALNRYRALQSDARLGSAARYNSANLLVRQAIAVRASAQPGQAIALLELAKEYYREVLRDDPANWDARYNLERAQRLLPDPDEEQAPPVVEGQNRERAATTMRGYSPGLP